MIRIPMRFTPIVLLLLAVPAFPITSPSVVDFSGIDATVTSFAGLTRTAASPLLDRDVVATGLDGSARLVSSTGWTAELGPSTRAELRTEPVAGGASPLFARLLDLTAGSLKWSVSRGAQGWLRTPAGLLQATGSTITVSFADGVLSIKTEDGEVQLTGNSADVRLRAGQWLRVHFTPLNLLFSFEIIEDNGTPIDIIVGATVVHSTKGDGFEIQIIGDHADVRVLRGLIQVAGPNKRIEEVVPGVTITVVNGAIGAIRGYTPKVVVKDRAIPVIVVTNPYGDHTYIFFTRTDISPS
jgi:hypothetical protein